MKGVIVALVILSVLITSGCVQDRDAINITDKGDDISGFSIKLPGTDSDSGEMDDSDEAASEDADSEDDESEDDMDEDETESEDESAEEDSDDADSEDADTAEDEDSDSMDDGSDDSNETSEMMSEATEAEAEQEADLCADKICDDSVTTCPDGEIVTCDNECEEDSGKCTSCKPDCADHPFVCDKECGTCQVLDDEECDCLTIFFCEGNSICDSTEWPDGEDCAEFSDCEVFDPNRQACQEDPEEEPAQSEASSEEEPPVEEPPAEETPPEEEAPPAEEDSGDVTISGLEYEGDDEYIEFSGSGIDMSGWTVKDNSDVYEYTFPEGTEIDGKLKLHSVGCPEDNTETDLYWETSTGNCRVNTIWTDSGDTATLKDSEGNVVDTYEY